MLIRAASSCVPSPEISAFAQPLLCLVQVPRPQQSRPEVPQGDRPVLRSRGRSTPGPDDTSVEGFPRRADKRRQVTAVPGRRSEQETVADTRPDRGFHLCVLRQGGHPVEVGKHLAEPVLVEQRPRGAQGHLDTVGVPLGGGLCEHAAHGHPVGGHQQRSALVDEQPTEHGPVLSERRVPERLHGVPGLGEPLRCASVEIRREGGVGDAQLVEQHLSQQRVVAEPLAIAAQTHHEGVRHLQGLQELLAPRVVGQHRGQVRADPVDDGGLGQEVPDLPWLAGQHLLEQVVGDGTVVPAELGHGPFVVTAEEQGCEPEPGGPALGALHQEGSLLRDHVDPVLREQLRRLRGVEGQVAGPDLRELVVDSKPVKRQRRVGAREQHEPQL